MRIIGIIISYLIVGSLGAMCQTPAEIGAMKHIFEQKSDSLHGEKVDGVASYYSFFVFYKRYVSPQDAVSCVFSKSCSAYMIESIERRGWFFGALNGIDRLMRCHGLGVRHYAVDKSGLIIDDGVE